MELRKVLPSFDAARLAPAAFVQAKQKSTLRVVGLAWIAMAMFVLMYASTPAHAIGSGISGLLHIQLARARGAAKILATDINEFRLKSAAEFGADTTIHSAEDVPARVRESNDGRLADLVIVCTGALPAIQQAVRSIDRSNVRRRGPVCGLRPLCSASIWYCGLPAAAPATGAG